MSTYLLPKIRYYTIPSTADLPRGVHLTSIDSRVDGAGSVWAAAAAASASSFSVLVHESRFGSGMTKASTSSVAILGEEALS